MAETEDDVYEEVDEDESEDKQPKAKRRSILAYLDLQRILLLGLHYITIGILTFIIAYWVSSRNQEGGRTQTKTGLSTDLLSTEIETTDLYTPIPSGFDWTMEELIINTADLDAGHYVKATIVVSYEKDKPAVLAELTSRSSQIHAEVRKIIGSKKYSALQGVQKQELLVKEIKTKIQLIIGKPGIIDIFMTEFTLH